MPLMLPLIMATLKHRHVLYIDHSICLWYLDGRRTQWLTRQVTDRESTFLFFFPWYQLVENPCFLDR